MRPSSRTTKRCVLARAVGVDLDNDSHRALAEKKGSDLRLGQRRRARRRTRSARPTARAAWIDAIHHAAHSARFERSTPPARCSRRRRGGEAAFFAALEAVLEVLPVSRSSAE